MADRVEIYCQVLPPGENIVIETYPFPIDYSISMVDNIEWAMCCLRCHHSGGKYDIRAESFQSWLEAATLKEWPDMANWERVLEMF